MEDAKNIAPAEQESAQPSATHSEDIRMSATRTIWGLATGMLGICIPLTAITQGGVALPALVLAGATITTAAVWALAGGRESSASASRIRELEERLANVEAITGFEEKLLERHSAPVAPAPLHPVAQPATFEATVAHTQQPVRQ